MTATLPIPLGETSSASELAADLGKRWFIDGKEYILVKASGAITAAAGVFYEFDGTTDNNVAGLADAAELVGVVAGVMPTEYDAVSIANGDYFLLQRRGVAEVVTAGATAAGKALAVHSTAGKVDDTTVTFETAVCYGLDATTQAATITATVCLP